MDEQQTTNEPLLTYRDTAKLLGVTDRTVWQLVKEGDLQAVRFGRTVRIAPDDLQDFIERAKRRGGSDAK